MTMADSDTITDAAVPGLRPGQALAEARVRKNFTVIDVAQQLKLSASQVKALEADAHDRLPGSVFVRGFVRNYARLVDLDGDTLVAALDLPHQPTTASAAIPHSRNIPFPEQLPSRAPRYASALILLIGALALYAFMIDEQPVAVVAHPPVRLEAPAPSAATAPSAAPAPAVPEPLALPLTAEPEAASDNSPVEAVPGVAVADRPPEIPAAARPDIAEMHFVFDLDAWVEVRDRRNRILMSQLNRAGTEYHLQSKLPLSFVVGNASGVRLTRNGAPIDLTLHTRVEVARFTLE